jgi:hypothetical protein
MGFKALPVFGSVNVDLSEGRKILAQSGFSSASIALVCALSDWEQWARQKYQLPFRSDGAERTARRQRRRVGGPLRRECEVDPRWQVSLRSATLWPPTSSPQARTGPPWSRSAAVFATRRTPVHSGFSGGRTPGLTGRFHPAVLPAGATARAVPLLSHSRVHYAPA